MSEEAQYETKTIVVSCVALCLVLAAFVVVLVVLYKKTKRKVYLQNWGALYTIKFKPGDTAKSSKKKEMESSQTNILHSKFEKKSDILAETEAKKVIAKAGTIKLKRISLG